MSMQESRESRVVGIDLVVHRSHRGHGRDKTVADQCHPAHSGLDRLRNDSPIRRAAGRDPLGLDLRQLAERPKAKALARAAAVDENRWRSIGTLMADRDRARWRRDFQTADALRKRLRDEFAVELVDGPDRTTCSLAPTHDANTDRLTPGR